MPSSLAGKTVAILVADGFEQVEFTSPGAFTWAEVEERVPQKQGKGVFEQARAFGAKGGLVVPVHGPLGEMMAVTRSG